MMIILLTRSKITSLFYLLEVEAADANSNPCDVALSVAERVAVLRRHPRSPEVGCHFEVDVRNRTLNIETACACQSFDEKPKMV